MKKLFLFLLVCISSMMLQAVTITDGALPGVFSIGANKTVSFSQGNLQYQGSTNSWRFAEHQWDVVGATEGNTNPDTTQTAWQDLFCYGTKGNTFKPYSKSIYLTVSSSAETSFKTKFDNYNINTNAAQLDWCKNAISNGGDSAGIWCTLSYNEWNYLLFSRTNASSLKGCATINFDGDSVYGLILLPDGSTETLSTSYTAAEWVALEDKGAVFLPAAGQRSDATVSDVNASGRYWTNSCSIQYFLSQCCVVNMNVDILVINGAAWTQGSWNWVTGTYKKEIKNGKVRSTYSIDSIQGASPLAYSVRLARNVYAVTYSVPSGYTAPDAYRAFTAGTTTTLPKVTVETPYVFDGWWDAATGGNKIGVAGDSYTVNASITLYAHIHINDTLVAKVGETGYTSLQEAIDTATDATVEILKDQPEVDVTVKNKVTMQGWKGTNYTIGNLTIGLSGDLTLSGALTVNSLILNTTQGGSSQLRGANNLTYTDAYVDIQLEPGTATAAKDGKYYAFGVPFQVSVPDQEVASTDIVSMSAPTTPATNYDDYVIWAYNGQMRAENKKNGWEVFAGGNLQPGQFYMFGMKAGKTDNVWRFKQSVKTLGGSATLTASAYASDVSNQGWNGLANSQLTYAQVQAGSLSAITYAQAYDNTSASGKYDAVEFSDYAFVMGSPFFIQVANTESFSLVAPTGTPALRAPMRDDETDMRCRITLSNATQHDDLYLTASEAATSEYQIGKDVLKMMGGTADSYIWANDYGYRLCANDKPLVEGCAEFDITLSASAAGVYQLAATKGYLYHEGEYVADLTEGAYTLMLNKGENKGYSIVLGEKKMPTGLGKGEEVRGKNEKFIYKDVLYIWSNGKLYNAQGQECK